MADHKDEGYRASLSHSALSAGELCFLTFGYTWHQVSSELLAFHLTASCNLLGILLTEYPDKVARVLCYPVGDIKSGYLYAVFISVTHFSGWWHGECAVCYYARRGRKAASLSRC